MHVKILEKLDKSMDEGVVEVPVLPSTERSSTKMMSMKKISHLITRNLKEPSSLEQQLRPEVESLKGSLPEETERMDVEEAGMLDNYWKDNYWKDNEEMIQRDCLTRQTRCWKMIHSLVCYSTRLGRS